MDSVMADRSGDSPDGKPRSLLGTAVKTSVKAWSTASSALRSQPVKRLGAGLKTMAGGLAGATRFVRANSLRGLLRGRLIISERSLNQWFARVEPPEGVSAMSLRCRPSRLVLAMSFERKLFGVPLGKTQVELPFALEHISIDHSGGTIELRLDRPALPELRGILRPIIVRLLSRAAADLLDDHGPLDRFDTDGDVVRREDDLLIIDVGRYPPFVELMNRELHVIGGRSVFPFRAVIIHDAFIEEGRLTLLTRIDREQIAAKKREIIEELGDLDEDGEPVEIAIVKPSDGAE